MAVQAASVAILEYVKMASLP